MSNINSVSAVTETVAYKETKQKTVNENKGTETKEEKGAVYEKSEPSMKSTYTINKMSTEERTALVNQLKADQEARQKQLLDIVSKTLGQQADAFAKGDDSIWRILAKGNFTVDPVTKAQAQADIAEDGYWGVKQTSQRLFDFACALAGDDVDKMKEMQEAMEKGFQKATKTWGQELPEICKNTIKAANQLFDDYFAAKAEN